MASNVRRQRQKRRVRMGRGLVDFLKMAAVVAVLVAVVILVIRLNNRTPSPDAFCEGVYVNGVSLGGLTHEEGVQKINELIDQRLNRDSFLLYYGDKQWTFTPSEFDAHLDLTTELALAWNFGHTGTAREMREQAAYVKDNPVHYDKEVSYDEDKLDAFIAGIKAQIDVAPVDAVVTVLENEILEVSQSQNGLTLSAGKLKNELVNNLLSGTTATIELTPEVAVPQYTTEELKENTQLIATWRTDTSQSTSKRLKNIANAFSFFDGTALLPGEMFSFNKVVGKRTKENGFVESPEYDGTTVISGIGGGTCQASSTLYGAALLANLDVVVRYNHSMTVGYVKASFDAAVSTEKDLRFVNNMQYPVYFYATVDGKYATVNIYGPPCQYDIQLENRIINIFDAKGNKYEKDTEGTHVYYSDDPPLLKDEGKQGMKSQGYRVYYDKQTGAEVDRQDFAIDTYYASQPTYWVGVHARE